MPGGIGQTISNKWKVIRVELFEISETVGNVLRMIQDLEAKVDRLELSIADNSAHIAELKEGERV